MRTCLLVCSVMLGVGLGGLVACEKRPPPKEPTITETVSDGGTERGVDAEAAKTKSTFERLGGKEGITKIVDAFIDRMTRDDVVKKRFTKLSKERVDKLKSNLVAQICRATLGDCTYTGKSMKEAHKGMKITEGEWNASVSALKAALDENKIGENEQNDLIAAIAPMREDIVEIKPKTNK